MSEALEVRAEIAKIARLLGTEADQLGYLEDVKTEGLIKFRDQLVELFFGGEIGGLQRFVGPSKILPSSLIASVTQEAVGPVLTARIAGLVDPSQAIAVVGRLPTEFLADVAVEIDPRRVPGIIGGLSDQVVNDIAEILVKRKEYVAMGRFVAYVSGEQLAATFDMATDADLLQTAFVLEDKDHLSVAVGLLPDKRLRGIMRAAGKNGLWAEAIDLVLHLDDEQYARVIDIVAAESDEILDALIQTAHQQQLWSLVVPIASDMERPENVMAALNRADNGVVKGCFDAVVEYALWDELYALLEKLSPDQRSVFRKRAGAMKLLSKLEPVKELLG
ncbi:MAG: hypothetical protein HZB14_06155 [Actinobacteria bacterium]|nr:hypothetical protein [Actinomycetota bacterium]